MQTTVQRLRYVLQVLEPAVAGKKATLPILQNVVVGQGRAWAMDLETAVTIEMPDALEEPLLLPHARLLALLAKIPGGMPLTIDHEGDRIKLTAGTISAEFPAPGEVADFPPLPGLQPIGEGKMDGDLFLKTANAIAAYAATETSRPVLQCVCVTLGAPLEMVGGNGFRLAWLTVPMALPGLNSPPISFKQLLIPTTGVHALAKVWKVMEKRPTVDDQGSSDPTKADGKFRLAWLSVAKRLATIRFTRDALSFEHGAVTIQTQLTQGEFPNYHQLIPADMPNKVSFDAEQALRDIKSVAAVAAEGSGIVRLQWADKLLTFSAQAEETGAIISGSVPAQIQGGDGKIAFNHKYLTGYLAGKLGTVLLETATPSSAGRFFHSGSPDVLIMPLFVSDPAAPTTGPVSDQPAVGDPADQQSPEEPTDDQQARHRRVDDGTPEKPAAAASPPTRSKKPRRRIADAEESGESPCDSYGQIRGRS